MNGDILFINLTDGLSWVENRRELVERFIGGSGLAINLLNEYCPDGVDPFAPENPIVLASGPFIGLYPVCSKTIAMFKSPLTGNLGESHAGGRLGVAIRLAGYEAIVIIGASSKLVWLDIGDNGEVKINSASSLKKMSSLSTIMALDEPSPCGIRSTAAIGPAGENFVYYANVLVDGYNFFGRTGLGAVMGAKNLKAIRITGCGEISVKSLDAYKRMFEKIYDDVVKSGKMRKYHDLGTPQNVLTLNKIKALPTMNFKLGYFEYADQISGEYFADNLLIRKNTCPLCPIGCKHVAILRSFFADEHEVESLEVGYDYEPIYALGSNLGVGNSMDVLKLRAVCDRYGLDAMMTGTMLAWATEAYEKGLIGLDETIVEPKWGDVEKYIEMIKHIITMPNEFYLSMAQGRPYKNLGEEFLVAIGGNGLAGYHTGLAFIIGTAIGARHSHLSNAGYSLDQKLLGFTIDPVNAVEILLKEEAWRCILESCGVCLFARDIYDKHTVLEALNVIGFSHDVESLEKIGRITYGLKYKFKFKEGFRFQNLKIPKRIFETATANGVISPEDVKKALTVAEAKIKEIVNEATVQ
ncbi:MAG: aldehyde ferredoxin oxidoreductase N-terminal domain-containing protein [Candidatus Bathyarchaeia archaeon]